MHACIYSVTLRPWDGSLFLLDISLCLCILGSGRFVLYKDGIEFGWTLFGQLVPPKVYASVSLERTQDSDTAHPVVSVS